MKEIMNKFLLSVLVSMPLICQAQISSRPTSPNSVQIAATPGYIYTGKGTPIKAFMPDKNTKIPALSNNNGWTFAKGEVFIDNDQIPILLKDEYKEISFNEIKDSDILVRYSEDGKVLYTLTACKPTLRDVLCEDKPQPDIFLFALSKGAKINKPETMKIYREIDPEKPNK